jgi:hypothetical protein
MEINEMTKLALKPPILASSSSDSKYGRAIGKTRRWLHWRLLLITGLCISLGSGSVSRMPVVTALGTTGNEDVRSLTIPGITLKAGDTLLVSSNDEGDNAKVTWNGISLHQDIASTNGNGSYAKIFSLYVASGGTGDIVATHPVGDLSINASSVTNLAPAALDRTKAGNGVGTDPSSGATPITTKANEFLWGAIGYASNDAQSGVWSDGFTSGGQFTFTGDTGGVEDGYKIVTSTGAFTAAKTGVTKDGWSALIATYAIAQ